MDQQQKNDQNNQNQNHQDNNNNQKPPHQKSAKIFNNQWILKKKISSGSFGVVFIAYDKNTKEQVAIKLEKEDNEEIRSLDREVQILQRLQGLPNIPKLHYQGQENNYNILVISLLGPDLAHYMKLYKKYSLKSALYIIDQLIPILENIHNRSIIHRDLKPENILMGINETQKQVFLIDFGISKIYRDSNGRHIAFRENKPFIGTTRYASIAAHQGYELGRKDDLESLIYVILFLLKGNLPWQNLQNVSDKDKTTVVGEIKQKTSPQELCKDVPLEFQKYLEYVKKLHFKSTPDYKFLRQLFQKLGKSMGLSYNSVTNYEYDWTEAELKKQEEEKQKLIQKQLEQEKLKKEQEKIYKEHQLKQLQNQNQKDENELENLRQSQDKASQKQQQQLQLQQQHQQNKISGGGWHRTISASEQENNKKSLLQLPNGNGQLNPSPRSLAQGTSRDSFQLGSNLSNSFANNQNNSSVYIQYNPHQAKDQNNMEIRGSYLGMSNINFDEIDHEAEKVVRGSSIMVDFKNNPSSQQLKLSQSQSLQFQSNKNNKKNQYDENQIFNNNNGPHSKDKDLFTLGTQNNKHMDEYSEQSSTLEQKIQKLQKYNQFLGIKAIKQKRKQNVQSINK